MSVDLRIDPETGPLVDLIPPPGVVRKLLARNVQERAVLRSLLALSLRAATIKETFGPGPNPVKG